VEINASCACGQVQFKSKDDPVIQLCCHCTDCQDALNREYAAIAFFKTKSSDVSGPIDQSNYSAESGNSTVREFCSECGTVMFDKSEGFPGLIGVMTQQINAPFEENPSCHVWVRSKLPSVSIPDGMRTHDKGIQ
jgi:hypothetical protein